VGKVAIFGGSFDPIHLGHLITAQDIFERLELDELRFMPVAHAPMKDNAPTASAEHRLAMIERAIHERTGFSVDERELRAGGISYTIDTVTAILKESPGTELLWLIGADHLSTLDKWREIEKLSKQIQFICAERPSENITEESLPDGITLERVQTHPIEISSSEIRTRIQKGLPVDLFLPVSVHQYIVEHKLYQ